jgi:hypothetical protein
MGGIEYLVLKRLCGKEHYLRALYEYIEGARPSDLASKYGMAKNHISALKLRIREKNNYGEEIAKRAIPIILRTPMPQLTLTLNGDISFFCRICGKEYNTIYPEDHIAKKHREILRNYTKIIIERLKRA